jgi:acyl-CoA hydrolase
MELEFDTSFTVMPKHCNYMFPMIFGGHFMAEMDLCAASCVTRLIRDTDCEAAVTYKFEGTFHAAAESGDLVFLHAKVVELRRHAVVVSVRAERERRKSKNRDHVADGKFVFLTKKGKEFYPHGLRMPEKDVLHQNYS